MTMTDPQRDALREMGLTEEQIDHALAVASEPADLPVASSSSTPATAESPVTRPCAMTAGDLFMSLNGFDEIAIASHFGAPIGELRTDPVTLGRALAFVHQRRDGLADREAYAAAMALTIQTVSHEYFTPDPKPDAEPASAEGNAPSA